MIVTSLPLNQKLLQNQKRNHEENCIALFFLAIGMAPAFSQINKGQWLVGGSASLDFSKQGDNDDSKVTSVTVSPDAGYFFLNNFAGGARVSFQSVKVKSDEDASTKFLFVPFVRYYFLPAAQKVKLFADASY
jgi:hypothetical protein